MNKKLMAVAVAGALAIPGLAVAQVGGSPGVSLYGLVDFSTVDQKFTGATGGLGTGSGDVTKLGEYSSSSRIGFRGREDLGGGMAAWFQAESGINQGRPDPAASASGVSLFGRDTGVGLDGAWGTVMWGNWSAPYKVAGLSVWNLITYGTATHYGVVMNNGDSTGTEPDRNCIPAGTGNASGAQLGGDCNNFVQGNTTAFSRRLANSLQWWSPNWSGFQVRAATQTGSLKSPDGSATPANPKLYSLSGSYDRGPFRGIVSYEQHVGFVATATTTNAKDTALQIGGKYNYGRGNVAVALETTKIENTAAAGAENDFKRNNYIVEGTYNVTAAGEILAGYSRTPGRKNCGPGVAATCGEPTSIKYFTLVYAHHLSKRTTAYVNYGRLTNGSASTAYYIAPPAGNAQDGTKGLLAGTDVTAFGVGVQYVF